MTSYSQIAQIGVREQQIRAVLENLDKMPKSYPPRDSRVYGHIRRLWKKNHGQLITKYEKDFQRVVTIKHNLARISSAHRIWPYSTVTTSQDTAPIFAQLKVQYPQFASIYKATSTTLHRTCLRIRLMQPYLDYEELLTILERVHQKRLATLQHLRTHLA